MINKELQRKIDEGEHQQQDFKYAINDSKKIARSLAAFANTDGGCLLVGVKDNGKIAGISSEEEFYMIEAAAQMYCRPPVEFETLEWQSDGKTVLEIKIPKSANKPHKAPTKDGKYMVYVRVEDQNLLANKILLEYWKAQQKNKSHLLRFNKPEKFLLQFLSNHDSITLSRFQKQANIPRFRAERILVSLLCMRIIQIHITEKQVFYTLSENLDKHHTPYDRN
ncbi:AlbA family DNA-binding domain-containing protein [Saccharicrinis fermentans]|uniref:Divergent AAA domain protein n=1 Tax=Saccharicrinis fermentans DSM 9555 = JCM 21142 TaxID=869213 RepID=W7YLC0_9BACT|nr:ATP-binding protein [Saccharicrinis fermentans]GAF03139.1 divergent AAA domain protein [Saccharicrinis fermentans DSM 9555 = JCM 21142]